MDKPLSITEGRSIFGSIPPGLTMFFQFPTQKTNHKTAYVGMVMDEAIILQLPATPGVTQLLSEAYAVVVRFVHDGKAYGFETRFLAALRKPLPLLFLAFPHGVQQVGLRSCDRLEVAEKALLTVGEHVMEGVVTDVSCGGCKLKLPRDDASLSLASGSPAELEFSLSAGERVRLKLSGSILDVDNKGKKVKCRMSFSKDQEEELANLNDYLQTIVKLLRD